jgi:hypothetical protein
MFDLRKNISEWKKSFLYKESFTNENLDELENHLTEQINGLKQLGLSDEESFWVAQKRIGNINALNIEFGKVNFLDIIRKRIFWMLFGIAVFTLAFYSMGTFSFISYSIIRIVDIKLVTLTYLIYSVQEVLFLMPIILILWIMSGEKPEIFEKFILRFAKRISGRRIGIMGLVILALSLLTSFLWGNGTQSINIAISQAEGYQEYIAITKTISPAIMIVNSMIIFVLFYFSFKKTYHTASISN